MPSSTSQPPEVARLVSVNVGGPREVEWRGETVLTSIWKSPVSGIVQLGKLNLAGDKQSDLSVHGGIDKSVYAYPSEHYAWWCGELPGVELPWGVFGENFSTEGLLEDEVFIGDRFRIGTAEVVVTQPRLPCFKLGIRFGEPMMVKRFLQSGRSGFYLKVAREGEVEAGCGIERLAKASRSISIAAIGRLHGDQAADAEQLRQVSELPDLARSWKAHFRKRLEIRGQLT